MDYISCVQSSHCTSYSQRILMLLVAGKEHIRAEVFTGELLPRGRQVFLLVHPLHLHIQYHMEQLGIFLRRVACVQLWSETEGVVCVIMSDTDRENTCFNKAIKLLNLFSAILRSDKVTK